MVGAGTEQRTAWYMGLHCGPVLLATPANSRGSTNGGSGSSRAAWTGVHGSGTWVQVYDVSVVTASMCCVSLHEALGCLSNSMGLPLCRCTPTGREGRGLRCTEVRRWARGTDR